MRSGTHRLAAIALLAGGWSLALTSGTFAAHMTAHMVTVALAPPLLLAVGRQRLARPWAAVLACAVELVVVWGWHMPWMHAAARQHLTAFGLEQASFLAAGCAVWAGALPAAGRPRSTELVGAGVLLLTSMHMSLLGGLLAVVPQPLYPHGHALDALWDQQLGGIVMLGIGGLAYLGGGLWLLGRALRDEPRKCP
ncbi:MAG TPA: cytochrome c oxidase assembly protein [Pseudomonadales bacterium]